MRRATARARRPRGRSVRSSRFSPVRTSERVPRSPARRRRRRPARRRPSRRSAPPRRSPWASTQDVDSTNPFTGIAAASYEIYQLQYDTLMAYAEKDFSDHRPAGHARGARRRTALTWTYKLQAGPQVVGRRAVHRQGRGLHVQPGHQRHLRADELRQLHQQHHQGDGAGRHDGRHEDQDAVADHVPPGRLHPAGAHLVEDQREGRRELRQRADPRASRSWGPGRSC